VSGQAEQLALHYKDKADQCRAWAEKAPTARAKESWLRLAAQWELTASEANPSGHLPWSVSII
jgi:hypothetical protein